MAGRKPKNHQRTNKPHQQWNEKIQGKAQKTGTEGHQRKSYEIAIEEAKKPETKAVHLDHGYKRTTEEPVKPNRRPDVTVVKQDGTVNAFEVRSRTDKERILRQRNKEAMAQLPEARRGEIIIKPSNKNLK